MRELSKEACLRLAAGGCLALLASAAGTASAQDFKVTLSGDAKFEAVFAAQDKDQNSRNNDFRSRFRMWVNPEATGLGGALTYGANTRLVYGNGDSNATFDRAYTYAKGAFGTVTMGMISTYSDDWTNKSSTGIQRPSDWQTEDDIAYQVVKASKDPAFSGSSVSKLEVWRDKTLTVGTSSATRLRYTSPFIYGFQASVGYAPKGGSSTPNAAWTFVRDEKMNYQDAAEIALNFRSDDKTIADKFGDAYLQVLGDYQFAKNGYTDHKDFSAWQLGAIVGYQGFRIGGEYLTYGKSNLWKGDRDQTANSAWNLGAQYKWSDYIVGVGYNYMQKDVDLTTSDTRTSTSGKKTVSAISTGIRYTVSKGLDVFGDYQYVTTKNTFSNLKDNASVVNLSVVLGF